MYPCNLSSNSRIKNKQTTTTNWNKNYFTVIEAVPFENDGSYQFVSRWESLNQIELTEPYKLFSCANLVRISEFFYNILEKQRGETKRNGEILTSKGMLLHLVNYKCLQNLQCKSKYYIDCAIKNKISPINVHNWKTKGTNQQTNKQTPLWLLEIISCLYSVLADS